MKDFIPWEEPHDGAGEESEEEERQRQSFMNSLQLPFPIPLSCSRVESRTVRSEDESGKKAGVGGRCF